MRILKALWGLLVDDVFLASILVSSLIIGCIASFTHHSRIGAYIIWAGVIISLWLSIEYQLKLKLKK